MSLEITTCGREDRRNERDVILRPLLVLLDCGELIKILVIWSPFVLEIRIGRYYFEDDSTDKENF